MLSAMKRLVTAFCVVALTTAANGALAVEGEVDEQVNALYRRGDAAAEQNDWAGAYQAYLEAWKLRKTFDIATNLGMTELRLGKPRDAARHLAEALNNFPPSQRDDRRQKVRELLQRAKNLVATLKLDVQPSKSEVFVDDQKIGRAESLPPEIYVDAGTRSVSVRLDGYEAVEKTVEAEAGRQYQLGIELTERLPSSGLERAGKGGGSANDDGARDPLPVYFGLGLTVVGLGCGVGFTLAASAREDDAASVKGLPPSGAGCSNNPSKACSELQEIYSDVDTDRDMATLGFVVGGASLIATATYLLWPSSSATTQSRWQATPLLSNQGGGVSVGGTF